MKANSDNSKNSNTGKMWRSVESKAREKYETESTDHNEFPAAVTDLIEKGLNYNLDRKKFLTIMGASMAMAGLNCVKEPVEKIVPYLTRPPEAQPGIPVYYATAKVNHRGVVPMLVKTREGKPIKVDAHDEHPVHKGTMTADGFAAIWELYDPDRLKTSQTKDKDKNAAVETSVAITKAKEAIKSAKNVRILSRSSYSPSEQAAVKGFVGQGSNRKNVVYDSTQMYSQVLEGERLSYGKAIIPNYRFDKADLIFSLGADFLGTWISPEVFTKDFTKKRNPDKKMNQLLVAECMMSLTGANSDERYPIKAGSHTYLGLGLAKILLPGSALAGNSSVSQAVSSYSLSKTAELTGLTTEQIKAIAQSLKKNKGKSLVVGGGVNTLTGVTGEIQIVANLLNSILGNDGNTVSSETPFKEAGDISSNAQIHSLIKELNSGAVDVLILDRSNPVYDMPEASGINEAIKKAKTVIAINDHLDESASLASIVIASSHFMESWGDGYSRGVYTVSQPVIRPLYDTVSAGEIWLKLQGSGSSYYDFIRNNGAAKYIKGNFNTSWDKAKGQGYVVVSKSVNSSSSRSFQGAALSRIKKPQKNEGLTLSFYESIQVGDGQNANNSYRHELPDPVTKICWDNFAAVSPADANEKNWRMGDIVEVKVADKSFQLPVFIQPGQAQGNVAVAVGYGHTNLGAVANGLGVNAWTLAGYKNGAITTSGIPAELSKVDSGYRIATTQRHHEMHGRGLVRYAEQSEYKTDPKAGHHAFEEHLEGRGLYKPHGYSLEAENDGRYKWGMTVDLSKCTGCSACVLSCYSENNIPVTGKDEVWRGREMSWMRIDRYYEGDEVNPTTHFAPVMCQHCENAPCENVCPVNATSHSSEGLNDMAYNRCIGTRYCLDNCPFKVRRFNFFENWEGEIADPAQMALNPDVTVRSRGVIEKCSFCVQRINEQRQLAKADGRRINEEDLKTACQQGCPADAISFGDLTVPELEVSKEWEDKRGYRMLEEINVKPRVKYLTRIINKG